MSAEALQGRVFDRWRHAQTLAPEVLADAQAVRTFLASDDGKKDVFVTKPTTTKIRSVAATGTATTTTTPTTITTASGKTFLAAVHKQLGVLKGTDDIKVTPEYARQIADALVLTGFITPTKDVGTVLDNFAFDSDVFVGVGTEFHDAEHPVNTIWSLRDGAIHAGMLKRKRTGFFAKFTGGKALSYVIVHEATHTLFVFESDVACTPPVASINLTGANVEFMTALDYGIKITSDAKTTEVVGAASKEASEEWLNAIINAGATYREAFNVDVESVQSIYELKDFDMSGNAVDMANYKGKVLLIVNVSSKCKLTPTNYPELAELDRKYRDQGLAILAFPCNQFANQEPGTHAEIVEFVKQYKCEFPFFEKHDVNGADARPVFTYLKAKLPGSFGNFVKWNFTKFLVDRNGQPYKRFAPKDLPMSFEDEIVKLLNTPAATEGATTTSGDGMSAADVTPTVAADNMSSSPAPVTNDDETKPPAGGDQQPADTAAATETVT